MNLYDLAFDFPEAHAIRKDDAIYYAFFAQGVDEGYSGPIQLRGLDEAKKYRVVDYVENRILGEVTASNPILQIQMRGSILLKAILMEAEK